MKKIYKLMLLFVIVVFAGCDPHFYEYDDNPPAAPRNVYVLNGDQRVDLEWDGNRESDVAGYNIYYSYSYDGKYTLIGSTEKTYYTDFDARNGSK